MSLVYIQYLLYNIITALLLNAENEENAERAQYFKRKLNKYIVACAVQYVTTFSLCLSPHNA
jgi:hypothetical protein